MSVRWYNGFGCLIIIVLLKCIVYTEAQVGIGRLSHYPAPHCSKACINSKCTGPERCSCRAGYIPNLGNKFECFAVCKGGCPGQATCTSPAKCECKTGYQLNIRPCEPMCVTATRGYCPHEQGPCVCTPEWRKNITSNQCAACVPPCSPHCGNGTCISPNVCKCFAGYEFQPNSVNKSEAPCVPICNNCEGTCVAPDKCICKTPYDAKNVTATGENCDCFKNCSDLQKKCEKTICVMANNNVSRETWWIYLLVAFLLITISAAAFACFRKRMRSRYNVNDTKIPSNPIYSVTLSEIYQRRS